MSKPKPPRVLDYDEEFGYVVAGTHDVDEARELLYEHLRTRQIDPWDERVAPEDYVRGCDVQTIWARCSQGYNDGQHPWMLQPTEPHARGAFRAVEWSR